MAPLDNFGPKKIAQNKFKLVRGDNDFIALLVIDSDEQDDKVMLDSVVHLVAPNQNVQVHLKGPMQLKYLINNQFNAIKKKDNQFKMYSQFNSLTDLRSHIYTN